MTEVKSKIYKAVRKDGKCVLVKKPRPKRRRVVKKKAIPAKVLERKGDKNPPQPQQSTSSSQQAPPTFQERQQSAQQREAQARAIEAQKQQGLLQQQQAKKQALLTQAQANQMEALTRAILNKGDPIIPQIEQKPLPKLKQLPLPPLPKQKVSLEEAKKIASKAGFEVEEAVATKKAQEMAEKAKETGFKEGGLAKSIKSVRKQLKKLKEKFEEDPTEMTMNEIKQNAGELGLNISLTGNKEDLHTNYVVAITERAKLGEQKLKELLEKQQKQQSGEGSGYIEGGMYNDEIEDVMKRHKSFKGAIAADKIPDITPSKVVSFVINKDKTGEAGSHWCSVYIDSVLDKECCYYDPLGNPPSKEVENDLRNLVKRINPKHQLKFKINTMKNQRNDTDSCAWHSMRFIKDMIAGKTFKEATGYCNKHKNNTDHFEEKAVKLANKFGYI